MPPRMKKDKDVIDLSDVRIAETVAADADPADDYAPVKEVLVPKPLGKPAPNAPICCVCQTPLAILNEKGDRIQLFTQSRAGKVFCHAHRITS